MLNQELNGCSRLQSAEEKIITKVVFLHHTKLKKIYDLFIYIQYRKGKYINVDPSS